MKSLSRKTIGFSALAVAGAVAGGVAVWNAIPRSIGDKGGFRVNIRANAEQCFKEFKEFGEVKGLFCSNPSKFDKPLMRKKVVTIIGFTEKLKRGEKPSFHPSEERLAENLAFQVYGDKWSGTKSSSTTPAPQSPAPTPTKPVFAPTDIFKVRDPVTGSVSTFEAQNVTCKKVEHKEEVKNWDPPKRNTGFKDITCVANGFTEDLAGYRKVTSRLATCANTAHKVYYVYNDGRPDKFDFSREENPGNNPGHPACMAALHFGRYTPGELSK